MNSEDLSKRLRTVAKYIIKGSRVADIGSDHAYLPCYAVRKGIATFAIAGEIADGPFQKAKRQVEAQGLTDRISVRKGNGLEVISFDEADCITIAGMGGKLIASILENGKEKLTKVKRLILQPNVSAITIRKWLMENGWELIGEEIIEEDDKVYEVLVASPGNPLKPYEGEDLESSLLLGPYLTKEKTAVFKNKWKHEIKKWKQIVLQLENASPTEENRQRRQQLERKIQMVEEVLKSENRECS